MANKVQVRADIKAIRLLEKYNNYFMDLRPLIAYTMRKSGCTYAEVGRTYGVSRQMAKTLVDDFERKLHGN